jgi:hypothetical protein
VTFSVSSTASRARGAAPLALACLALVACAIPPAATWPAALGATVRVPYAADDHLYTRR